MPTRQPTELRQIEIVLAALRLAGAQSPAGITTTHLAEAVGISQGAVFKHFASKDAIWLAAMAWASAQLLSVLEAAASAAGSPLQALEAVFMAHIGFVQRHPGVPRLIFHELQRPDESPIKQELGLLLKTYRQLLRRLLAAALQRAELPQSLDLDAAATLFVGVVQGLVMQSMLSGQAVRGPAYGPGDGTSDGPTSMQAQARSVFAIYRRGIGQAA